MIDRGKRRSADILPSGKKNVRAPTGRSRIVRAAIVDDMRNRLQREPTIDELRSAVKIRREATTKYRRTSSAERGAIDSAQVKRNEQSRRFWKAQNDNLQDLLVTHPQLVIQAANHAANLVTAGHISDPLFTEATSVVGALPDAARLREQAHKEIQRKHARKTRSHAANNPRGAVIAAMAKQRREGNKLMEFLVSAEEGSIDTLTITLEQSASKNLYRVECEGFEAKKIVTYRTLEDWWKSAESVK